MEILLSKRDREKDRKDFLIQKVNLLTNKHDPSQIIIDSQKTPQGGQTEREYLEKNCLGNHHKYPQGTHPLAKLNTRIKPPREICFNNDNNSHRDYKCYESQLEYLRTECFLYQMERKINSLSSVSRANPVGGFSEKKMMTEITSSGVHHDITAFVKRKCHSITNSQREQFIQEALICKTGPMLIADIIKEGPKPSDSPENIWKKLKDKLHQQRQRQE